jgi:SWI/SNF-related matrix-associated actin-dependent regulator 1 of chromatin subfamily A
MLRMHREDERWVCRTDGPDDRFPAKQAGFRWDPDRKVWWSDSDQKALVLREFAADDAARAALERIEAGARESLQASRATDASIDVPAPEGLEYLPYQRAGIAYALGHQKSWIADEMGLGKTIQAIGVLNGMPEAKNVLIVCPASLKLNWKREIEKWSVRPAAIGVARGSVWIHGLHEQLPDLSVHIINYDILKRHRDALREHEWDLLVVDESHYLKNAKAGRTVEVIGKSQRVGGKWEQTVAPLVAKREIWLSGTPISNRPSEGWVPCKRLAPEIFNNWKQYHVRYCNGHQGRHGWDVSGASNLPELQDKLRSSVMIRRLKKDVLTELPAKRRQVIELDSAGFASLLKQERAAWDKIKAELAGKVDGDDADYAAAVANMASGGLGSIEVMAKIRHEIAIKKAPIVAECVRNILDANGKVIVFAHHKAVVDILVNELREYNPVKVTGDVSMDARQAAVDRFQHAADCRVFVGNIQAAGVGLTLTASSHVVFAELDWVPGNLSQAEDRAHRIGQQNAVLVQHFVVDGSIDAYIAQACVRKQAVLDAALDNETDGSGVVPEAIARPAVVPEAIARPAVVHRAAASYWDSEAGQLESKVLLRGVQILARVCDGAITEDGHGFNGGDAEFGHSLAQRDRLSPRQAQAAKRMLVKYHRQLPDEINEVVRRKING